MNNIKMWIMYNKAKFATIVCAFIIIVLTIACICMKNTKNNNNDLSESDNLDNPYVEANVNNDVIADVLEPTQEPEKIEEEVTGELEEIEESNDTPKVIPTLKPELQNVTIKVNDVEDPDKVAVKVKDDKGTAQAVDFSKVKEDTSKDNNSSSNNKTLTASNGIDVSSFNGDINWRKVADAGVEFAIVRIGYRGWGKAGVMVEDAKAKANLTGAISNGIKVGVYYFSTAVTEEEAIDEAVWVCNYISKYNISYPVAYDCEQYDISGHRNYGIGAKKRTDCAMAFMKQVKSCGYKPIFYASSHALLKDWETSRISASYKIWKANYNPTETYYYGVYDMFQYTSSGTVDGIRGKVDLDIKYVSRQGKPEQNPIQKTSAPNDKPEPTQNTTVEKTQEPASEELVETPVVEVEKPKEEVNEEEKNENNKENNNENNEVIVNE